MRQQSKTAIYLAKILEEITNDEVFGFIDDEEVGSELWDDYMDTIKCLNKLAIDIEKYRK